LNSSNEALALFTEEVGMSATRCALGLFLLVSCWATSAWGQVGKDTQLWQWTAGSDHHSAIVQIGCNGGIGTGVVIQANKDKPVRDGFEGYILTAYHVVKEDKGEHKISIQYRNGRKSKGCSIVQFDEQSDVAVLWAWIPADVTPAKVAGDSVKEGDVLEFCGLGGGSELQCCLRHFSAKASCTSGPQKIFADVSLLPGDSGGPVFNSKQEVVGVISGGWFWWDGGVKAADGNALNATWPARASNLNPIQLLMADVQTAKVEDKETIIR
jgi:serine protease Do